jgi:dihydrofolate reductase
MFPSALEAAMPPRNSRNWVERMMVYGLLGQTLLKQRLVDVLDLAIYPILVNQGRPLFREGQALKLKLAASKSFSKIVKVTYEPQY